MMAGRTLLYNSSLFALAEPIAILDELDPIAEGVGHVEAPHARHGLVGRGRDARLCEAPLAGGQVGHQEGWMGLARRRELPLDAEVNLHAGAAEPAAAPCS